MELLLFYCCTQFQNDISCKIAIFFKLWIVLSGRRLCCLESEFVKGLFVFNDRIDETRKKVEGQSGDEYDAG